MKEEDHGSEEAQLTQADEYSKDQPQESETRSEMIGVDASAYEAQIAERDERYGVHNIVSNTIDL